MLSVASQEPDLFSASPALFVENRGQWLDASVRYLHQGDGANVALTDAGATFQVFQCAPTASEGGTTESLEFAVRFPGANAVSPTGHDRAETLFNFFVGPKEQWRSAVPSYQSVAYHGLYDGIDLYTWGQRSQLKYEFHVMPGADSSQIQIRYQGIEGLSISEDGSLVVNLGGAWGNLIDQAPHIYQIVDGEKLDVAGQYVLLDTCTYSFAIAGSYDPELPLVIDPELTWSTYLGGVGSDAGYGIAVDESRGVYVAGKTYSGGWTSGGFDTGHNGFQDAFVAKLTLTGAHVWSTYLGGARDDYGADIALDASGGVYVAGGTDSPGWTTDGFDTTHNGSRDAFAARLTDDGQLVWSTYLGGSGDDDGPRLAVDGSGGVYVAGRTNSPGWADGGFDTSLDGPYDAFVAKLTADGESVWSTYLGGTNADQAYDVAVDTDGNLYVTGETSSPGWADGGFDTSLDGPYDAFVAKLTSDGSPLWSTYLGGSNADHAYGIAVDHAGNTYVAGKTGSAGWITGGFDTSYNGAYDAFVAKLTADGGSVWSTYLGGADTDQANDVAVDSAGNVYVAGSTLSAGWTAGGFDTSHNGAYDAFVAKLTPSGSHAWSTYLGGSNNDQAYRIAARRTGRAYVTGGTDSPGWTARGFDTTYHGYSDAFVAKITENQVPRIGSLSDSPNPVAQGNQLTLSAHGVTDPDGRVMKVEFYLDANNNGKIDSQTDTLLGTDTDASDGWTWTGSTSGFSVGANTYLARARDDDSAWSAAVSVTGTVTEPANQPPSIASLTDDPDPVFQGNNVTLSANGVTDSGGMVVKVEFYRDTNGNDQIDAGTDTLLGTDTSATDGWTWTGPTADFPLGANTYLARAQDDDSTWSNTVVVKGTVIAPPNYAPSIALLTDSPDAVPLGSDLTLSAEGVTDRDGTVVKVEFYLDANNNSEIDEGTDLLLG
ncbi:MAG: SBBP repeat-containing protein, partial [Thermoguttaceae bacterium]|nr:SBBP repeat-containing protein [Thermoguttaceae bacterium]